MGLQEEECTPPDQTWFSYSHKEARICLQQDYFQLGVCYRQGCPLQQRTGILYFFMLHHAALFCFSCSAVAQEQDQPLLHQTLSTELFGFQEQRSTLRFKREFVRQPSPPCTSHSSTSRPNCTVKHPVFHEKRQ